MTLPPGSQSDDVDGALPKKGPYPGLRPFKKREWPVFFGRERMTDEAIKRLVHHHFLVVHGDSGCGKSSLLSAGVLARLEQESARSGLTWRTCETQPRDGPLDALAESLAGLDGRPADDDRVHAFRRVLNSGAAAPREVLKLISPGEHEHICVFIDQFEELFAFAKRHGRDEATLLIQFLMAVLDQAPRGLYVVVTMRSEFLGVCAQYPGFAEAVNRAQYLLPRMNHSDLLRAIREPATLRGGRISSDLAERLIADAGGGQDELPLIQHALSIMHWRKVTQTGKTRGWSLDLDDYRAIGSPALLLSNHADDLSAQLGPDSARVIERLFRELTDINAEGQAVRRPRTIGQLIDACADPSIAAVIDVFRAEGASLLTPYRDASAAKRPLPLATLIDISHEALIRCWKKIADPADGWLVREFRDGLVWRSLLVQADSFDESASKLLSLATAEERAAWLAQLPPSWPERYGGGYRRVSDLVQASVDAGLAAQQAERSLREREVAREKDALEAANIAAMAREEAARGRAEAAEAQARAEALARQVADAKAQAEAAAHQRSEAMAKQSRRQRNLAFAVAALVLIVLVLGAFYYTGLRDRDEERARTTELTAITSSLEFLGTATPAEIKAMRRLQKADDAVKKAFLEQVLSNPDVAKRFNRDPDLVFGALVGMSRADRDLATATIAAQDPAKLAADPELLTARAMLSARLESPDAVEHLAMAIASVSDPSRLRVLGDSLVTAGRLQAADTLRATSALNALMTVIRKTDDAYRLATLATGLSALGPDLSGDSAIASLTAILGRVQTEIEASQASAIEPLLTAIAAKVPPSRALEAVDLLVSTIRNTTDTYRLLAMSAALRAALGKVPPDQTARALDLVQSTQAAEFDQRLALGQAVSALPNGVPAPQAARLVKWTLEVVERPSRGETPSSLPDFAPVCAQVPQEEALDVLNSVIAAAQKNTDRIRESTLASALKCVIPKVPAMRAVSLLVTAIQRNTNASGLWILGNELTAVVSTVPKAQTGDAAKVMLDAAVRDFDRRLVLVQGLGALPADLPLAQTGVAVDWLLETIRLTPTTQGFPFSQPDLALWKKLSPGGTVSAVASLTAAIQKTTDAMQQPSLGRALDDVIARVPPDDALRVVELLIAAVQKTTNQDALESLAQGFKTVGPKMPERQIDDATTLILTAARRGDANQRFALVRGLGTLPGDLSATETTEVTGLLLELIKRRDLGFANLPFSPPFAVDAEFGFVWNKVAAGGTVAVVELLIPAIEAATGLDERSSLSAGLLAVVAKVPTDRAKRVLDLLVGAIPKVSSDAVGALGEGLVKIVRKLDASQTAQATKVIMDAARAADANQRVVLMRSLAALPGDLSLAETSEVGGWLLDIIGRPAISPGLGSMAFGSDPDLISVLRKAAPKGTPALVQSFVAAFQKTTDLTQRASLGSGLDGVLAKVPEGSVKGVVELLVAGIQNTTDSDAWRSLSLELVAVIPRVPVQKTGEVATLILESGRAGKAEQRAALLQGLAALPTDLTPSAAGEVLKWVLDIITGLEPNQAAPDLAAAVKKASLSDPIGVAQSLVATIQKNTVEPQLQALGFSLMSVVESVPPARAADALNVIVAASRSRDANQRVALVRGVGALPGDIALAQIGWVVDCLLEPNCASRTSSRDFDFVFQKVKPEDRLGLVGSLVTAVRKTTDTLQLQRLGASLPSVARSVPAGNAIAVVRVLSAAIQDSQVSVQQQILADAIVAPEKASDATEASAQILAAMAATDDANALATLGRVLLDIAQNLPDEPARAVLTLAMRNAIISRASFYDYLGKRFKEKVPPPEKGYWARVDWLLGGAAAPPR